MIITFASSKGGVGKSTACAAVGGRLAVRGDTVFMIDLDQNRTVERWGRKARIQGLTVRAIEREDFSGVFREVSSGGSVDHILIDLAGARETTALKAFARSDLVVIPAQASEPDLREALVISKDVRDVADEIGRAIPYRLLLTKMSPLRTRVTEFAYQEMARHGLPVFQTTMVERVAYKEMFLTGVPPAMTDKGGAGAEVASLVAEMEAIAASSQEHQPHQMAG